MMNIKERFSRIPSWGWLALAAGLRLTFALKLGERFYQTDEGGFFQAGLNFARLGVIGTSSQKLALPPVPTVFFGYLLRWGGERKLAIRLGQALLGAAIAGMIGRMTARLTGSQRAGRLALALSAVYPFFIYYGGMILSETLYVAAVTAGLWLLCEALGEDSAPSRAAGAGFLLALAALSRAEGAPIALVIWAIVAVSRRLPWRSLVLGVLCWALPLSLWCARNKAATGSFALDLHGGMTMLHGSLLFDYNEIDTSEAQKAVETMPFYQAAANLGGAEKNGAYLRQAFVFMRENPRKTLGQWARKFVNFWRFYPRPEKVFLENDYSHPSAGLSRSALVAISLLFEPALILLGMAGLWGLKDRWRELFPLGLFILGSTAIHMVSVSQMRYRLAVMPILIMGACFFAAERLGLGQSRKR